MSSCGLCYVLTQSLIIPGITNQDMVFRASCLKLLEAAAVELTLRACLFLLAGALLCHSTANTSQG